MARVLDALDADALEQTSFRFGGGTCLALRHGEYRLSRGIDFVCSDAGGYADLRLSVRARGYDALFPAAEGARGTNGRFLNLPRRAILAGP